MKRIKWIFLMIILFVGSQIQAQGVAQKFYDKYVGKKGYSVVNISPEMFKMFSEMKVNDGTKENKAGEMIEAASKLKSMLVISVSKDSIDPGFSARKESFASEARGAINASFTQLMEVREQNEDVRIFVKRSGKIVSELVLISEDKNKAILVGITGDIDLNQIGALASKMGVPEFHGKKHKK